jgi:hypothetical protein
MAVRKRVGAGMMILSSLTARELARVLGSGDMLS